MDRGSTGVTEESGGSRIIIQLVNALAVGLMIFGSLGKKLPPSFKYIKIFIALLLIYVLVYTFNPKGEGYTINHYVRLFTNLLGFLFFYNSYFRINNQKLTRYVKLYAVTLMLSAIAKIMSSALFSLENLGAGDTASISLVFLIPLFFIFFSKKQATILYLIAFVFTVVSLRRTCIIAFVVCLPYVFSYVKGSIKIAHVLLLLPLIGYFGFSLWQSFGGNILIRFSEMTDSKAESLGSGRSIFYVVLLDDFFSNPNGYLFGYGLNSVWSFFQSKDFTYLPHAHNDFLEILYTFGGVGLILWISFIVSLYRENLKIIYGAKRKIYYMSLLTYLIVAMASGTILRIEMLPFVMAISFILAEKNKLLYENTVLFPRIEHSNVLVAKNPYIQ